MSADLLLRYCVIVVAMHLACAWVHTFQSSWPLVDAFNLAESLEEQLIRSLGIRLNSLPSRKNVLYAPRLQLGEIHLFLSGLQHIGSKIGLTQAKASFFVFPAKI